MKYLNSMPERFHTFGALEASMGRRAGDRGDNPNFFWGPISLGGAHWGPKWKEFFFFSSIKGKVMMILRFTKTQSGLSGHLVCCLSPHLGPFWNHLLAYLDSLRLLRVLLGLNIWALAGNRRAIANTQTPWGPLLDELGTLHGAPLWH